MTKNLISYCVGTLQIYYMNYVTLCIDGQMFVLWSSSQIMLENRGIRLCSHQLQKGDKSIRVLHFSSVHHLNYYPENLRLLSRYMILNWWVWCRNDIIFVQHVSLIKCETQFVLSVLEDKGLFLNINRTAQWLQHFTICTVPFCRLQYSAAKKLMFWCFKSRNAYVP